MLIMRDAKRATQPPPIYVFDVYTLGKDRLRPILDLLKCPSVSKIFYDSRIDAAALYHEYNLNIVNDLDLQLAEVLSRHEGNAERMRARLEQRRTSFLVRTCRLETQRGRARSGDEKGLGRKCG